MAPKTYPLGCIGSASSFWGFNRISGGLTVASGEVGTAISVPAVLLTPDDGQKWELISG